MCLELREAFSEVALAAPTKQVRLEMTSSIGLSARVVRREWKLVQFNKEAGGEAIIMLTVAQAW